MTTKHLLRLCLLAIVVLVYIAPAAAQDGDEPVPLTATSADLMKVNLLFVGAHPDDDSTATATLARYALDGGATTGVITATRGEGGGNSIGRELGPALGIVREAEERMALGELGVNHINYLNELDWAFTTSASAAEQFWGYEEPLGNLVRLYRVLRPDVVITMNPSAGSGHGHHQYIARLATEAFFLAGDPTAFPEQLSDEFLEPWQPKKLYYALAYGGTGLPAGVEIPTNEYSPNRYMTYSDLEASALRLYRSQGFDAFFTVPPPAWAMGPESFTLAASVLPTEAQETDLLAGITSGIGQAPANVELEVHPSAFYVSQGGELTVDVEFRNYSDVALNGLTLALEAPDGWTVDGDNEAVDVPVGETASASFTVQVPDDADVSAAQTLSASFTADDGGQTRTASKSALVQVTPPVSMQLQPIQSVQIYRDWTERVNLQQLVQLAPTQIAIGAGETGMLPVILTNRSNEDVDVSVTVSVDNADITLESSEQQVTVPAGETLTVNFPASVPADMAQGESGVTAEISYGDYTLTDSGTIQVVPTLTVSAADSAPVIDGDLSEYASLETYAIPYTNLWEGETTDAADLTGSFSVTYDDNFLYVAVSVTDDTVVSNIAPNDVKGHWRSDSVEITIDPQGPGASEHTLTTFKTGIFPFDTEGNVQAERDADANQGLISVTAPDMQVASAHTDDGYALEVAIPWNALPATLEPGDSFGFDVLLYDCDKADAAVGENCNEARTAWSAWPEIQGNPRVWGHATLE